MIEMSSMERVLEDVTAAKTNLLANAGFEYGEFPPWYISAGAPEISTDYTRTAGSQYSCKLAPGDKIKQQLLRSMKGASVLGANGLFVYGTLGDKVTITRTDILDTNANASTYTIVASDTWEATNYTLGGPTLWGYWEIEAPATNAGAIYIDDTWVWIQHDAIFLMEKDTNTPINPATEDTLATLEPTTLGTSIISSTKTVAATGTPEALGSNTAKYVRVQALSTNTKSLYVGGSAAQNFELNPMDSVGFRVNNSNLIYVKVQVNGEGVAYLVTN